MAHYSALSIHKVYRTWRRAINLLSLALYSFTYAAFHPSTLTLLNIPLFSSLLSVFASTSQLLFPYINVHNVSVKRVERSAPGWHGRCTIKSRRLFTEETAPALQRIFIQPETVWTEHVRETLERFCSQSIFN